MTFNKQLAVAEALKEAQRSTSETVRLEGLQSWTGTAYAGVTS